MTTAGLGRGLPRRHHRWARRFDGREAKIVRAKLRRDAGRSADATGERRPGASGHWIPAEGDALREILDSLRRAGVPADQIRVLIGNRQTWGALNYFATLAARLPVWPPPDAS